DDVARNPLRECLQSGRFCHVVEIVASRISREARLLEVASQLAMTPGVMAGSITSYAGGAPGQDPLRVGTAARARGLTPNIHVTCVSKERKELRQFLDDHGIQKPVLGNVYVLGLKPAEKMSKGEPPGCWVAPELVEKIRQEVKAKDAGEAARLERAARMVAILRGLGYAGAYIGGTHNAEHLGWIIERGQILAQRWKELAEEFTYAPKSAF